MGEGRRDFVLPRGDLEFLERRHWAWETLKDGPRQWLVLHGYSVPCGYRIAEASVALEIPSSYPTTQVDMAYFRPALQLEDGRTIRKLSNQVINGNQWQRWSRHRTRQNPWRPDVDCIETHLLLVDEWLERELHGSRN